MEAAKGGKKSFSFGGGHFGGTFIPQRSVDVDVPAGMPLLLLYAQCCDDGFHHLVHYVMGGEGFV